MQSQNTTVGRKSKRAQWLKSLEDESLRRIAENPTGDIARDRSGSKLPDDAVVETDSRRPKAERTFSQILKDNGVHYRRTGFPDYAVLDTKDGVPVGFIEVKRGPNDLRRFDQIAFERFCEKFHVPYSLWWPGLPLPDWTVPIFKSGNGRVLGMGERAGVPRRRRTTGSGSKNGKAVRSPMDVNQ
jgi:hypothetical protein